MKRITLLLTIVVLCLASALVSCNVPEPVLILSPNMASNTVCDWQELTATIYKGGIPVSDVEVSFEFTEDSVHYHGNLAEGESFDFETYEWPPEGALISEHWKKEKVYTASNNYIYCSTGPAGQAYFRYQGIYEGVDTIVVSASVDGTELTAEATVTWTLPDFTLSLSPTTVTANAGEEVVIRASAAGPMGISGKSVCFELLSGSTHYLPDLPPDEFIEMGSLVPPPPGVLLSEHWKKERVYTNSDNYIYGVFGSDQTAQFCLTCFTPGTDVVRVSTTVDGTFVEATATITWVGPTTPCPVGQYYAEYYNYTPQGGPATSWQGDAPAFTGQPLFSRCEDSINYDWGDGGVGQGVGNDYFLARWTGTFNFDAGDYIFSALVDDGVRIWVDGSLLIDEWSSQVATEFTATLSLTAGYHEVRVEYFERTGVAICQVSWELQP